MEYLKVVRGAEKGKEEFSRFDPLDFGSLPLEVISKTHEVFGDGVLPRDSVSLILNAVRSEGDAAVRKYARLLDGVDLESLEVTDQEIEKACDEVPEVLVEALRLSANRVTEFHQAVMRKSWVDLSSGLGELVSPLDRVGIYAPGGTAAYPSTVLMTAIPAKTAGVREVVLATPSRNGSLPNPAVLVAAKLAGVDRVYRVGGVPAIGAMAFGTESVPKVDKICGPGNIFVTYAKKLVFGEVNVDGLYGPTETLVVADESANPVFCAADLLAQAEHDPLATPVLVTTSLALIAEIEGELDSQLSSLDRSDLASQSLSGRGRAVLVDSLDEALELANIIAPEHLCLMVKEPWDWAGKVRHAGGIFLGDFSPEVMGDYVAGPSHVMPTGGTARFSSALSVHQFLRTMPIVGLKPGEYRKLAEAASVIARAEGLTGHARAVEVRLDSLNGAADGDKNSARSYGRRS